MKLILLALLILLAPEVALADEPTGFAEIPWGTSHAQVIQPCTGPFPPTTFPTRTNISEMSCWRSIEINGKAWNPRLFFVDRQLAAYQVGCGYNCYAALRQIIIEKFGNPHRTAVRQYRMNNGSAIEGEVAEWDWPGGTTAVLVQRDGKIDYASLFVATPMYATAADKLRQERAEKAKKAF